MEQSKQADQEEYLEEGEEDVGGGGGEEEEGEEGGDASIQNCGPDFPQRLQNPCIPVSRGGEEPVCDVYREVYAETNRDDEGVAGDHIDGEAPEVHESGHVDDGGGQAEDHDARTTQTSEEEEDCDEYCEDWRENVSVEFLADHAVCLPVSIPVGNREGRRDVMVTVGSGDDVWVLDQLLHGFHGGDPLGRLLEEDVAVRDHGQQ